MIDTHEMKVWLGNLSISLTDEELVDFCRRELCELDSWVRLVVHRGGSAILRMRSREDAEAAVGILDGKVLKGRDMVTQGCKPDDPAMKAIRKMKKPKERKSPARLQDEGRCRECGKPAQRYSPTCGRPPCVEAYLLAKKCGRR